jgi:uncharacterized protein DUF4159
LRLALALAATLAAGSGPAPSGDPRGADPRGADPRGADLPTTAGFRAPPPGLFAAEDPDPSAFHEFQFTRAMYTDVRPLRSRFLGDGGPAWSTDFPKGDRQFMVVARRLSVIDASQREHFVSLADPEIRRFPFLYAVEVGWMRLTGPEVKGLREYLAAGGFLVIDDFWGSAEWAQFERQIRMVLPDNPIVDIPRDHLLYRIFYDIDGDILQVPNVGNAEDIARGYPHARTWERDGFEPHLRGIFDDDGRLLVVINWNTDLGDAWEWAENPYYPLRFSTYAYQMGVNFIIYAMSH